MWHPRVRFKSYRTRLVRVWYDLNLIRWCHIFYYLAPLPVLDPICLVPPYKTRKKSRTFYRNNIYSYFFITIQTVFSSIKSPFYYISILKLIYVDFYTILLANDLTIMHLSRFFTLFSPPCQCLFTLSK